MRGICFLGLLLAVLAAGCERAERNNAERGAGLAPPGSAVPPAELVFRNGYIHTLTLEDGRPAARAMAVRNGRIVFVGSDADVEPYIGPDTQVENLRGKLVLPGFVGDHTPVRGVDLYSGNGVGDYREAVAKFIREHPDHQVIVGEGWDNTVFAGQPPHKGQLDQVSDTIPIVLFSSDRRSIWANSEALAAAGINNDTPDPPGGVIEKDDTGLAIGVLRGESAMALVEKIIPEKSGDGESQRAEIREIQESGSLESGKWADFIVLDKKRSRGPDGDLQKAKVLRTYHRGEPVFDAETDS